MTWMLDLLLWSNRTLRLCTFKDYCHVLLHSTLVISVFVFKLTEVFFSVVYFYL